MNRNAYVICWFKAKEGVPVFVGAGIYSEDAGNITCDGSAIPMDVLKAHGKDYQEARDSAKDLLGKWSRYSWLLPHINKGR